MPTSAATESVRSVKVRTPQDFFRRAVLARTSFTLAPVLRGEGRGEGPKR
jgi:hypothetical protein